MGEGNYWSVGILGRHGPEDFILGGDGEFGELGMAIYSGLAELAQANLPSLGLFPSLTPRVWGEMGCSLEVSGRGKRNTDREPEKPMGRWGQRLKLEGQGAERQ